MIIHLMFVETHVALNRMLKLNSPLLKFYNNIKFCGFVIYSQKLTNGLGLFYCLNYKIHALLDN